MQPGPEFDDLVRRWTPYAESWAYRQECRRPGTDWWGVVADALWRAARTFEPDLGFQFSTWFAANIRGGIRGTLRRHRRRAAKLTRVGMPRDDLRLTASQARGRFALEDQGLHLADIRDSAAPWVVRLDALRPRRAEVIRRVILGGEKITDVERSWEVDRNVADRQLRSGLDELRAMAGAG